MNVHERESDSFTLFTLLTAWIHLARVAEGHVRFICGPILTSHYSASSLIRAKQVWGT